MFCWHIGNTTVRSPYRLIDALKYLSESNLPGNLNGRERESAFTKLLSDKGIVITKLRNDEKIPYYDDSIGRKWRHALVQMGFLVPKLTTNLQTPIDEKLLPFIEDIPELTGRPFEITPHGHRMIKAETFEEQQDCLLRSLLSYRFFSGFERKYTNIQFSPLKFVIDLLMELESLGESSYITFQEIAFFVQTNTPINGIENIIEEILTYRKNRNKSENKKRYDQDILNNIAHKLNESRNPNSLRDYADINIKYLKSTGLFTTVKRGISLLPEKMKIINLIHDQEINIISEKNYYQSLWKGSILPTDDKYFTIDLIGNYIEKIKDLKEDVSYSHLEDKSLEEINHIKYKLEEQLKQKREIEYANNQLDNADEIIGYLNAFQNGKLYFKIDDETFTIPNSERPAYFEWAIWRSFLAIDSLVNPPWESRGFKVDQDFLPVYHAPSGIPDMIFEFENFILVVEVTLLQTSRQEAAEGEPVRRHVAKIYETNIDIGKRVLSIFISQRIDSNTAETFRIGNWYTKNDEKISLSIVPISLEDFISILRSLIQSKEINPERLFDLIIRCLSTRNTDAPLWKEDISKEVKKLFSLSFEESLT